MAQAVTFSVGAPVHCSQYFRARNENGNTWRVILDKRVEIGILG
ncbi:hypothetical protein RWK44_33905 [Rhizobium sp. 25PS6]|nr:hypothetical protein [Rhizobium sp. 25PS6]MDU0365364.1 hypothetical protein [Rhizobium sp. 25PS6]